MQAIQKWMEAKDTSECPMCSEKEWVFDQMELLFSELVKLPCDNCGYVLFLAAGKVSQEPEGDEVEEATCSRYSPKYLEGLSSEIRMQDRA